MKGSKRIGIMLLVIVVSGCYYDNEEDLYPSIGITLPDTVTYTQHIQPLAGQQCALSGCHVNGTGLPVLDNYSSLMNIGQSGKLKIRVIDQRTMPPSGPLSTYDRMLIQKWIDTGFKQ